MIKPDAVLLQERNFKVNYLEVSDTLWKATTELKDELHHIKTWLDISVPEFKVKDAGVEFMDMPFEECKLICDTSMVDWHDSVFSGCTYHPV